MREITGEAILRHVGVASLLPAMREALKAEAEGKIEVPLRAFWGFQGDFGILGMPARSESLNLALFKFLTLVDSNRARGLAGVMGELTLLDAVTGEAVGRLPAEEVTLLRTATCSAVATKILAPPGADSLALFGSGPQAAHHAEAMLVVRPIRRVLVMGRDPGRAGKLAETLAHRFGIRASIGPDRGFMREARIICTATNATEPLFAADDVHPHVHINAIGAYRPDMKELPALLLQKAAIFADSKNPVAREAGDLLAAFGGPDRVMAHIRALGELIGASFTRPDGPTVYKAVGNAGQDLYAAAAILKMLESKS